MKRNLLVLFLTFGLTLFITLPTMAQDATVESNPVTIVTAEAPANTTVEDGGVVINVEAPADETPAPPTEPPAEPEPWYVRWIALAVAGLAFFTKGVDLINKWLDTKKVDTGFVTGAELVGRYTPGIVKSMAINALKAFIKLGGNLQELLDEATDDVPYVVKVSLPPSTPSANVPPIFPSSNRDA